MNFEFSDEQVMLRDSLSRLLDQRYAFESRRRIMAGQAETGIWSELVDMGIVAMPLPEACGGLGGSASDIVAISELFGRHLVIEPLLPSVILTGRALARFDPAGPVPQWIADIGTGALRGAFAHEEGSGTGASSTLSTKLYEGEAGPRIRGSKKLVLGGGEAGVLLISALSETKAVCLAAVPADAEGIEVRRYRALDGRPVADTRPFMAKHRRRLHDLETSAKGKVGMAEADARDADQYLARPRIFEHDILDIPPPPRGAGYRGECLLGHAPSPMRRRRSSIVERGSGDPCSRGIINWQKNNQSTNEIL